MWNNNNNSGYGAPPSFPSFPDASGYGGQNDPSAGYQPGYNPSYGPPSGPPPPMPGFPSSPGYGAPPSGYGPPPGPPPMPGYPSPGGYPPPSGPPPANRGFPGAQYRDQHQGQHQGQYQGQHQGQHQGYGGQQHNQSYSAPGANQYHPSGPPPPPPSQVQNYGPQGQGGHQQYFQYSQCNGKKKALCIGINYFGQDGELRGCINDVKNIKEFLCSMWGYRPEDIVTLTDDATNPRQMPTRQNIIEGMQWLVRNAQPNDSLFFHYSGHGGQTKDVDGDEGDGYDEVIYPMDFEANGHIVDDVMHDIMVKPLPAGCRLTTIFDSCHSGSALDLPYIYSTEGKVKEPNLYAEAGQGLMSAVTSYAKGDMGGVFKSAMGLVKTATGKTTKADKISKATRTSPADVISWSGCKDSQTSADTQEAGTATGAMSFAFTTALRANRQQSYQELLNNIRDILRSKYSQKPQLSSSHPMDTNIAFIC